MTFGRALDGAVGRLLRGEGHGAEAREDIEPETFTLAPEEERALLASVDEFLSRGLALKRWWDGMGSTGRFADRFELGRTFNEPARSFGFFDRAPVIGQSRAVMGNFQEMFYDQPKSPRDGRSEAARRMRDQMRQFVLRYFMRVSDFREPEGYTERPPQTASGWPELLSWCPKEDVPRKGFGFQQLYYKRRDTGEIGKFPAADRFSIIDLREIGSIYEWILVKVCIFDFNFAFRPFGSDGPQLVMPLQEDSFLVLTRDFIRDQDNPHPGLLGRFGLGYAFIKNPRQGLFAYGPGEFDAAIELIDFEVRESGETRVEMVFVANRPERLVNVSIDPLGWGLGVVNTMSLGLAVPFTAPMKSLLDALPFSRLQFDPVYAYVDLADLLTGGVAAEQLCISRDQLDREFLVKHFMQHYSTMAGSLATWRLIRDWLDESSLPAWAIHGRSF